MELEMATGQTGRARDTARAGMDGRINEAGIWFPSLFHLLITSLGALESASSSAANKNSEEIYPHLLQRNSSSSSFSWKMGLCTTRRVGGSAKIPRAW